MTRTVEFDIGHSLTEPEWDVLRAFCFRARRLIDTSIVSKDDSAIAAKINYSEELGLSFEAKLPPEDQVAEFLMAFRFFYLEKEPTNFYKILALFGKHVDNQAAREALKLLKSKWANALFDTTLNISLNGRPMTAALLLDLWFNAHYFHSDQDKEARLSELNKGFTEPFSKYMLLDATYTATKALFIVYNGLHPLVESRPRSAP